MRSVRDERGGGVAAGDSADFPRAGWVLEEITGGSNARLRESIFQDTDDVGRGRGGGTAKDSSSCAGAG